MNIEYDYSSDDEGGGKSKKSTKNDSNSSGESGDDGKDGYEDLAVEKEGYLTKRGGMIKTWRKRWCTITENNVLHYYANKKDKKPKGRINLQGASVEIASNCGKPHAFEIATKKRTYFLYASDVDDKYSWTEAVKKAISQAGGGDDDDGSSGKKKKTGPS